MGIRTNTLGKSAIINRQLNGAYDIVEYVADNLPLLMSLSQKIDLALNLGSIAEHLNNNTIHLTEDEKDFINNLMVYGTVSETQFENTITNIMDSIDATEGVLESTQSTLDAHVNDLGIHYSQEERIRLNEAVQAIQNIISKGTLATVAYSGSYNDLLDKPTNNFQEQLDKKAPMSLISKVGKTNNYDDLDNKPVIDDQLLSNSTNAISNKAVFEALQDINDNYVEVALDTYSKASIDNRFKSYYTKEEVETKLDNLPIPDLPDIDLSNYYNKEEVDELIDNISIEGVSVKAIPLSTIEEICV